MRPTRTTLSAAAVLLFAAAPAAGFAPPALSHAAYPPSALPMSTIAEDPNPNLLSYASLCAQSDACSIDSAESYLQEILSVQSGCGPAVAGTLTGNEVCDDVQGVSAVVADLRAKVRDGAKRQVRTTARAEGGPVEPAYLAVLSLCVLFAASALQLAVSDSGVVPFTMQEVWWAVRDGYAADLAGHALHNGGLLVGHASGTVGSSLTPQELFWSIRDGYVGDALLSRGVEGEFPVPFAPRELYWAIRDGYVHDVAAHWFIDGGLVV